MINIVDIFLQKSHQESILNEKWRRTRHFFLIHFLRRAGEAVRYARPHDSSIKKGINAIKENAANLIWWLHLHILSIFNFLDACVFFTSLHLWYWHLTLKKAQISKPEKVFEFVLLLPLYNRNCQTIFHLY